MPYQVSRTDTGQFVLLDPATDTVVIDDSLSEGFAKLERAVADKPRREPTTTETAAPGESAFAFRGGPRYTPILLAVVLPFAWLAVLYLALANLLAETALDRGAREASDARIEQLERDLQAVRGQLSGAPRTAKTKPTREPKPSKIVAEAEPPEVAPPEVDDELPRQ
jgi:hypothetical protein